MKIFERIKYLRYEHNTLRTILLCVLIAIVGLWMFWTIIQPGPRDTNTPSAEPKALVEPCFPEGDSRDTYRIEEPARYRKPDIKQDMWDFPEEPFKKIGYQREELTELQEAELNEITDDASWHIGKMYGKRGIRITTDKGNVYFIPILEGTAVGLLETEGGRMVLRLSVLSILFILFLLTWRSTKKLTRPRKERIIETRVIAEDKETLHKRDIRPFYTQDYKDSLNEKYNYYGPEGDRTWITWVYNDIKSRKLDNSNAMMLINQLRFGWILDLMDYDYYLECIAKTGMTYGEIERLVDCMEFQQQEKRRPHIEDEPEQECRSFKSSEEYENFLKSHEPEELTDGEGIKEIQIIENDE